MESIKLVNMEKSTIFVVMDSNSTPKRLPAEEGKKSGDEDLQEKGQAGSEALSFTIPLTGKENKLAQAWLNNCRLPEVSGFSMARKA